MDLGLFILRVVVGLLMLAHGSQKLFGWFGGHGLAETGGFFEMLGFRPGRMFAAIAATGELFSGLLVAAGFLGPVGPALMLAVMFVAAVSVHLDHGLFAANNGIEVPLLYSVVGAGLIFAGPGQLSVDALLRVSRVWTPALDIAALALAVIAATLALALRRPAHAPAAA